jgi:predicted Holliday junction resolvase-like endonuclease
MSTNDLISTLKKSALVAECSCGYEFRLSEAIIFDGLGKMPSKAEEIKNNLLLELKEKTDALNKRKVSADAGAEKKAIDVGIGKIMEKLLPTCSDFPLPVTECRPLFEPIDMLAFKGMSVGRLESIIFIEIKTGGSKLNNHQKLVKEAVEDKKVFYEEMK